MSFGLRALAQAPVGAEPGPLPVRSARGHVVAGGAQFRRVHGEAVGLAVEAVDGAHGVGNQGRVWGKTFSPLPPGGGGLGRGGEPRRLTCNRPTLSLSVSIRADRRRG